jgi:hypothetical protein
MMRRRIVGAAAVLFVLGTHDDVHAQPAPAGAAAAAAPVDEQTKLAREAFREGVALVEQSEWAAALVQFEKSLALKTFNLTIYNIGVCQRFLGRYTLAERTLTTVLERNKASPEMAAMFVDQASAYLEEIRRKLARVNLAVAPVNAATAIDGRPLEAIPDKPNEFVAGVAAPGEPKPVGAEKFTVVLDPGAHVFTFQLEGHDTIEMRRDIKPGTTDDLNVSLTEQDAEIAIDANRPKSVVRVDDVDVGLTPVKVTRPPGNHVVTVQREGFVTYKSSVNLRPGQHLRLAADLPVENVPITKRWWFWTAAVSVVAGGALVTYAVTRPDPQPPPYERGSTGWLIETR